MVLILRISTKYQIPRYSTLFPSCRTVLDLPSALPVPTSRVPSVPLYIFLAARHKRSEVNKPFQKPPSTRDSKPQRYTMHPGSGRSHMAAQHRSPADPHPQTNTCSLPALRPVARSAQTALAQPTHTRSPAKQTVSLSIAASRCCAADQSETQCVSQSSIAFRCLLHRRALQVPAKKGGFPGSMLVGSEHIPCYNIGQSRVCGACLADGPPRSPLSPASGNAVLVGKEKVVVLGQDGCVHCCIG